eukprot:TRINITY_DN719_c0_g1_i4.p1 TRINITY_DN719_c0_g1~~TRINITY_DN719_c0_g1_i4.p1  ORF type:complete len:229 (+),score=52.16 TRINITY_DN719_c0_g1_i4:24-689(+)
MALPFALASTTVSVAIIYLLYLVGLLTMTNWFTGLFATLFVFMLAHYLVPIVLLNYMPEQNLKEKYNAEWAVVTGGSSGIGASIVQRLANQGINVAIVALDDDLLKDFTKTMQLEFKELEFRAVGVNMSADGYLDEIIEQTKDINVSLVFNNAGYLMVGVCTQSHSQQSFYSPSSFSLTFPLTHPPFPLRHLPKWIWIDKSEISNATSCHLSRSHIISSAA